MHPCTPRCGWSLRPTTACLKSFVTRASEGRSHWVGTSSNAQTTAVDVSPEILSTYVGTYRGPWGNTLVTIEVTLEDGELLLRRDIGRNNAAAKQRLVAQSDTTFRL